MEACREQGGILPTIQTEQDYNDAKVIAGTFMISLTINRRNSTSHPIYNFIWCLKIRIKP